ncbi:MAG: sulfite exporter TauE/SafE family protein [Gammaproteobacteria bacterium]|nr:sulfite exporter TauE/SafE family protein [Gammaproteobacteria bacterium]
MIIELILYSFIGIFAGIAAGLLGVGGGLIIVPLLLFVFTSLAIPLPAEHHAHIAIATSLATIIFTAISAIIAQQKKGAILWDWFRLLLPGLIIGSFIGAIITTQIPHQPLIVIFCSFLIFVSWKMWPKQSNIEMDGTTALNIPMAIPHSIHYLVGMVIGIISAIVGIGGGTMTVPYLNQAIKPRPVPIKNSIAVSSALGLPIAIFSTMGFIAQQTFDETLTPFTHSIGYIYLPAFISISIFAFISAKLGVYLSHKLDKIILLRFFSLLLMFQTAKLIYDNFL